MGETHVAPGVSSADHHHGESETAIYVVAGHPAFVVPPRRGREPDRDLAGDYVFVPPFTPPPRGEPVGRRGGGRRDRPEHPGSDRRQPARPLGVDRLVPTVAPPVRPLGFPSGYGFGHSRSLRDGRVISPVTVKWPCPSPSSSSSHPPRPRPSPASSAGLPRRVVDRAHPGPAPQRRRRAAGLQGRVLGPPRRRRRQRLQAALRGLPREEGPGQEAQGHPQGRQRAVPRHRRGPRGRVDRLAPARGAGAPGPGQAHGLPRDHPAGHRAGRAGVPGPRPPPGRRPGDPPHPRPPVRLRGLPGPVEEGHARPVGGPGAVGRHPPAGRAGTGPDALRRRLLLGPRRPVRRRGKDGGQPFGATLVALDGRRLVTGRDFGEDGQVHAEPSVVRLDEDGGPGPGRPAGSDADFAVRSVEETALAALAPRRRS